MAIKKGDTYKVNTKSDPLHLRSKPNGTVIAHLKKGTKVKIADAKKCTSTWLYITYNGKTGYGYKKYLSKVSNVVDLNPNGGKKKSTKKPNKKVPKVTPKPKAQADYGDPIESQNYTVSKTTYSKDFSSIFLKQMKLAGLYDRNQIVTNRFNKFFRYGHIDPYYNIPSNTREYIFFTRPNLHITDNVTKNGKTKNQLNLELAGHPFFQEMYNRYYPVLQQLENKSTDNNLCQLLSYHVDGSVDLPSVTSKTIEGPQTIYGIGVNYRADGRQSDYNYDFSIQFKDDKLLTCYRYFKAWEEYERLKKKGLITPPSYNNRKYYYQENKVLHDQIGIYKFIVGEDGKELLYYAYYCGCFPKSVPRDAFNELKENPTYSIDWECFRVLDMDPRILYNFNMISGIYKKSGNNTLLKPNSKLGTIWTGNHTGKMIIDDVGTADMTPADIPFIRRVNDPNHISGYSYQLLWYVSDPKSSYKYINDAYAEVYDLLSYKDKDNKDKDNENKSPVIKYPKPTDPTKPTKPVKPMGPTNPINPPIIGPPLPIDPNDPAQPIGPTNPIDPPIIGPTNPINPPIIGPGVIIN